MVMRMPSRPVSLLLVCHNRSEGSVMRITLEETVGDLLSRVFLKNDVREAFEVYKEHHPDIVIMCGFESGFSEALTINIRRLDGKRHTGIIVMAPVDESVDQTVANNYHAGADDVISSNTSLSILRSKMITVINHKIAADELRTAIHKLAVMSLTDELTGLCNMRGFLNKFDKALERCASSDAGMAVLMLDLDHFKRINDTMNHLVGSQVIKMVGHIIRKPDRLEPLDFAGRYGGDEYIVVLHGAGFESLMKKADDIRDEIFRSEFRFNDMVVRVTCSMGLCFVPPGTKALGDDVIKAADAMLYRSKEQGRNRVAGIRLGDPINFDHVSRTNLVDRDAGGDDDSVPRIDYAKAL